MRVPAVFLFLACASAARAGDSSPQAVEFFESKVRPLLVDHCFSCHGDKKQEAGLRLDSRDAILKGSDSGPVVVPGEPEKSKLIKAVRHEISIKMPPKGKLPADAIEALTSWVKQGAPFPPGATKAAPDSRTLWAYQPVKDPALPAIREVGADVGSPIDRFILAKLEAKGLSYSPPADKRTLIRRATYDLIGLPPTAAEIEAFEKDQSPGAYEKLVDRLLASPHYGEAQARHWLDLARYSDTKGYVFQEDRNYPYAYTYRDWVIRAFNNDMPYDRFVELQIAADRLNPADKGDLAAMGFLTLGRRFLNNIHDIIDDRLDVTSRTFLGLTVTCARCHDHKFDPIPSRDYYSLYGVFASSTEPKDLPIIGEVARTPEYLAFEQKLKQLEDNTKAVTQQRLDMQLTRLRSEGQIAAYLLLVRESRGKGGDGQDRSLRMRGLNALVRDQWRHYLDENLKNHSPVFAPWQALAALADGAFSAEAAQKAVDSLAAECERKKLALNPIVLDALKKKKPASLKEAAAVYGEVLAAHGGKMASPAEKELADVLGSMGPLNVPLDQASKVFNTEDRNKVVEQQKKVDAFKATSPGAPARAMVLTDSPNPTNPYVFLRGNPGNHGPSVPRQFLEILSGAARKPFKDGSGRLELAKAIVDPSNPLTARVMVNRLWLIHFGNGLVRTPSDFGVRSDPPSHPELLDWLAVRFVESGWSIKKMHRLIMLSQAYRQGSEISAQQAKVDPENRLIGRMNRRRLDFEAMRDSLLFVSGQLDGELGGKPVDIFKQPFSHRRTVYGFIDRQNLPGTFRAFDFAGPDQHSPQRFTTTVPQQALFLMNSPFVLEQARKLAARPEVASKQQPADRVAAMIQLIYGRPATPDEISLGVAFINNAEGNGVAAVVSPWKFGYGGYDDNSKRVTAFAPLPHWTGSAWQGGEKLPDPVHGWAILNMNGGHPGKNPDHAVVRRWVSPVDGEIVIAGVLAHPNKEGDGVRGRIVSSRHGELGESKAKNGSAEMNVRAVVAKGDTVDFVVDCIGNENSDSFTWAPVIRFKEKGVETVWDAARDFSGPKPPASALGRWEELAQVFLLGNEFVFID
jgi:Protein of unknown function (DUF1553)/Protein of unknown function (DUF1549)/Planctomycete cytochrome C